MRVAMMRPARNEDHRMPQIVPWPPFDGIAPMVIAAMTIAAVTIAPMAIADGGAA